MLQRALDGYEGTHSEVHDYLRILQHLAGCPNPNATASRGGSARAWMGQAPEHKEQGMPERQDKPKTYPVEVDGRKTRVTVPDKRTTE